jgi:hypothetical protein
VKLPEPSEAREPSTGIAPAKASPEGDAGVPESVVVKPAERSEGGEPRRNRTFNPQIKSLLLCQLS